MANAPIATQSGNQGQTRASGGAMKAGRPGITLVVMSDEKVEALADKARSLVEILQRHDLELVRQGLRPRLDGDDGCCNCVAC